MTTSPAHTDLDRLLASTSKVDPVSSDVLAAARTTILNEAHATTARAALIMRRRRRQRRLLTGVAAAAAAGVIAVTLISANQNNDVPGAGGNHLQDPRNQTSVEPAFTTVAQVVDAAADASANTDPAASPYWKVVTRYDCGGVPDNNGAPRPAGSTCQNTMWTGTGRSGVLRDANGGTLQIPQATISIGGQTLTWDQANNQTWTDTEVASMLDHDNNTGTDSRGPAGYYAFKNAVGLLTYSPASPVIREQVWRYLANLRGATFNGRDTDAVGRSGWRLTWTSNAGASMSIIVDTTTGLPLEQTDQAPDEEAPNVTTVLSGGPTNDAPATTNAENLSRTNIAQARACDILSGSSTSDEFQAQTGDLPQVTSEQHACMDSATGAAATN